MFKLAQEKGIAPWEVMLLIGFAVLLTALCLSRLWQRPTPILQRVLWSSVALVPVVGPLLFILFFPMGDDVTKGAQDGDAVVDSEYARNLTPRTGQVFTFAREEANRLDQNFIGTEHVLLGLIKLGRGVALNVLQKVGVNLENVRAEVERLAGTGPDQKIVGKIPASARVKKVLATAAKEAKALSHTYIGTEHILLGLLCESDGMASRVLQNLGVDIARTRQEILKELDPKFGVQSSPVPRAISAAPNVPGFTPHAQEVLLLSRTEADRFNHRFVGTEHLLLGILKLGQGRAVSVLRNLGLDLLVIRVDTEKWVGAGPDQKLIGNIPYTPRVKQVLSLAAKEARALNHRQVGTDHILLGLLREGDGIAARVLQKMGMTIDRTRQEIVKIDSDDFVDGGLGI
jgi:ATP-dependent Clp protease ATP-binding subunit ClpA